MFDLPSRHLSLTQAREFESQSGPLNFWGRGVEGGGGGGGGQSANRIQMSFDLSSLLLLCLAEVQQVTLLDQL